MLMRITETEIKESMQKLSQNIIDLDNVRFAGLIDKQGTLFAGGFKKGIIPHEDDVKRRHTYVKLALESCLRNDFNDSLGTFKYSTRQKISIITMNFCNYFLVFTKHNLDFHHLLVKYMI